MNTQIIERLIEAQRAAESGHSDATASERTTSFAQAGQAAPALSVRLQALSAPSYLSCTGLRLDHWEASGVQESIEGLASLAQAAGLSEMARWVSEIDAPNLDYRPGEKLSHSGLDIVFFENEWEFRFSPEVAGALVRAFAPV